MEESLYDRLRLCPTASSDEIRGAFRLLAKEYHPDAHGGDPDLTAKFHAIRAAYEILIDPELRKNYNKSLRDALAKEKKERIQEKLFTIDTATKLEIILAWSTTRPSFKTSFANSCLNCMAEGRELTERQIDAIDNIILSFQIDVDIWLEDELRNSALEELIKKQKKEQSFQDFDPEE